jgi:hypothetical protein
MSISNHLSGIILKDDSLDIANLSLNCNNIEDIINIKSSNYHDITYIDIPSSFDDGINSLPFRERRYLINHKKDLQWKLYDRYLINDDEDDIFDKIEKREIINKFEVFIRQVIGGDFGFKKEARNFIYKKNGDEFNFKNVADGIKAFAIIKILLESKFIQKDSILIID